MMIGSVEVMGGLYKLIAHSLSHYVILLTSLQIPIDLWHFLLSRPSHQRLRFTINETIVQIEC